MHNRVGQQLGNYRLLHLLGQGGFADVYLGEHLHLNTRAAVKVLHERIEERAREKFLREAQTIATLKHPHILRIMDYGMEDSNPFLVMEYAPGGTLRQKHPHGSTIPLTMIVSYVKQITSALQYAHDHQLVHRDVKPENMLIDSQGSIVLADFGIATSAYNTQGFSTQDVGGTPYYMSPEQCRGKAREASDQYALAVVVYEWLCGQLPFYGASAIEIAMHHLMDPPPPLQGRIGTIPLAVEQVVMRALAKNPAERFPNVQEFAFALEQGSYPSKPSIAVLPLSVLLPKQTRKLENTEEDPVEPLLAESSLSQTLPPLQPSEIVRPRTLLCIYHGHSDAIGTEEKKISTLCNYSHQVATVAWSPDGKYLSSGGWDKFVQIWDFKNGKQVQAYSGHEKFLFAIAWSPDGKYIASGSSDKTVRIWSYKTGEQASIYSDHHGFVFAVQWSPDGKFIASGGGDKTVQIWNATTCEQSRIYNGHIDGISGIAWSPDSIAVASASHDKTVHIWKVATGEQICRYSGHAHSILAIAWSPDGSQMASADSNGTIHIWDVITGKRVCTYNGHQEAVHCVAWSPDGTSIASGSNDKTVRLWNADGGKEIFIYHDHTDGINSVAWSPNGKYIASASKDGTVRVWAAI